MKEQIIQNIDNPRQLEKLYRENKTTFKREFNLLYPEIEHSQLAQVWSERLNFEKEEISWGVRNELIFVLIASCLAGLIAKIPNLLDLEADFFYPRNYGFIIFPMLIAYFSWKQNFQLKKNVLIAFVLLISILFINLLPGNNDSDTLLLSFIHLPLFLWSVLGFTFVGDKLNKYERRIDFLRYNGDLIVMTSIILFAGGILTGLTLGLFSLIKVNIFEFYFNYIVIWGAAAAPIVGTYLVQSNPQLVDKVSPVIAKVFTPIVFVTLVVYLLTLIGTGKDPYTDREFLIIFNVLLIGVMAIIFFSIAETSKSSKSNFGIFLLLGLSFVTIIINGIALSAILFRISEWGITPNRFAVLGGNILILTNLILVTFKLFKTVKDKKEIEGVEQTIACFLPIYTTWAIVVTFVLPILFNFK